MPGKRKYCSVSEQTMKQALSDIEKGKSQRFVCQKFGIPRGTLQNKLAGRHENKPGHPTILTQVEEEAIVAHVIKLGDWGFPLDSTGWYY